MMLRLPKHWLLFTRSIVAPALVDVQVIDKVTVPEPA